MNAERVIQSGTNAQLLPFEIRAHRLIRPHFDHELVVPGGWPIFEKKIVDGKNAVARGDYDEIPPQPSTHRPISSDIFGDPPTDESVNDNIAGTLNFLGDFLALPDDAPVELTRTPDRICALTCSGLKEGGHCIDRNNYENPDRDRLDWEKDDSNKWLDNQGMDTFMAVTSWLGGQEGEQFVVTKTKPGEERVGPEIESVLTTKGVLVEMIRNKPAYLEWKESFQNS